jgi:hypothetical protein
MRIALGVAILAGSGSIRAELVTYRFSGTVDAITDTSSNHYVPTSIRDNVSSFVGMFRFEDSAPGSIHGTDGFFPGLALDMSASVTIDGRYTYSLMVPSSQDEIDILGDSFEFFKRGPTVHTAFAPFPPFSHFEFLGHVQTDILSQVHLSHQYSSAGVSDQQTAGARYYFIGAGLSSIQQSVPEPCSVVLVGIGAGGLLAYGWARRNARQPACSDAHSQEASVRLAARRELKPI